MLTYNYLFFLLYSFVDPYSPGTSQDANITKRPYQESGTNGKSSTTSPFVNGPEGIHPSYIIKLFKQKYCVVSEQQVFVELY